MVVRDNQVNNSRCKCCVIMHLEEQQWLSKFLSQLCQNSFQLLVWDTCLSFFQICKRSPPTLLSTLLTFNCTPVMIAHLSKCYHRKHKVLLRFKKGLKLSERAGVEGALSWLCPGTGRAPAAAHILLPRLPQTTNQGRKQEASACPNDGEEPRRKPCLWARLKEKTLPRGRVPLPCVMFSHTPLLGTGSKV